jgi:bacteriorhodopsin
VEGACAVSLSAAAVLTTFNWRQHGLYRLVAQSFAILADAVGMILITVGAGADSTFNFWFHRIGIAIAIVVLGCLCTWTTRNALTPEAARIAGQTPAPFDL